jgi:non-ribosomal peptide synthetase-like protein
VSAPPSGKAGRRAAAPAQELLPTSSLVGRVLMPAGVSQQIRWRPGERLERLFEERCDALRNRGLGRKAAVETADLSLTFDELDARANQLARYLAGRGARAGDKIALLFDQPLRSYVGILAVLKLGAAFVPLDAGFPPDRLGYIIGDADAQFVLSLSHLHGLLPEGAAAVVCVDDEDEAVAAEDPSRLRLDFEDGSGDLAYIIYTSGSTGRPKGVAVEHRSICNFVRVAAESYGYLETDRVYQGMTIAFDFSVEEIWIPWMAGATLVPKPGGRGLLGMELDEFLRGRRITAMCCVPTLLATLDEDLPDLRFLLVSGEACPRDLIRRWYKAGRRFLNVYGPTEATVTATWDVVHPDKPVTLGVPLPTYSAVILDPDRPEALAPGELGEIGIAGIGLAVGYVNRNDLTGKAFVEDFLQLENNPSGRIYRTGDLGRFTPEGTIEYHGRIDTQVKIRGYRIELSEIESVLLQVPGVAQAVVDIYRPEPDVVELAGYYSVRPGAEVDEGALHQQLRGRLPAYMMPAYLTRLDTVPMMPSGKADRKNLPAPSQRLSLMDEGAYIGPETPDEEALAAELGAVLKLDRVSVQAHFFDDLGMNSLLLARFSARVRKNTGLPPLAIQEMYGHPTIRGLAAANAAADRGNTGLAAPAPVLAPAPSTLKYVLCGVAQLLIFLAYMVYAGSLLAVTYTWVTQGSSLLDMWLRAIGLGFATFVALSIAPIILKWILIGRWQPKEIPLWGWGYIRFWLVKTLNRTNPMVMFVGSPLYVVYLRALGAKIGKNVAIFSRMVPVCTDLIEIGDGTVIDRNAFFLGYRARSGVIQTGRVTLGRDVLISQKTTLDIDTAMANGAQLGHASSLQTGQTVPAGQSWHGSPATPTDANYRRTPAAQCSALRKVVYTFAQLFNRFVLLAPVFWVLIADRLPDYLAIGHLQLNNPSFYLDVLTVTFVVFWGAFVLGLIGITTIPRVLYLFLKPDKVYPLYGIHYALHRMIGVLSNAKLYKDTFGDSSYIVYFLKALGYDLGRKVLQTGSNFGPTLAHDNPFLNTVGYGTMVSDGLAMANSSYSNTSFRLSRVTIGDHNYLGNDLVFPSGATVGENVLLATKVMIPIDGTVRHDVGLLGSPPFEIPRSVQRDKEFDELKTDEVRDDLLQAKNRHNIVSMVIFLNVRWFTFFIEALITAACVTLFDGFGALAVSLNMLCFLVFRTLFTVAVEWAVLGFRALVPQYCSIYDPYFWFHERLWKMLANPAFNGTPFKPVIWRMLGVKVGKRLYDAGCNMAEKTLVTIGDDCALNEGTALQGHSMEDGTFKSGYIVVGDRCSFGVESFVNYGAKIGDRSSVEADALLMKGEEVPPQTIYSGNPARQTAVVPTAVGSSSPTRNPVIFKSRLHSMLGIFCTKAKMTPS